MPEPWRPGLPPVGTICDVLGSVREWRGVRVEVFTGTGGGFLLRGGVSRFGWPGAVWESRFPTLVCAQDCHWRPIEVPAGL